MNFALIVPAFVAGLITFLAPCTLPLVPGYIGFISGISLKNIQNQPASHQLRRQIMLNGVAFVLGFSLVFISFGSLAGLIGQSVMQYETWLARIGGIMIIFFGLAMLEVIKIDALLKTKRLAPPRLLKLGRPLSAFIIGATFALGWTPCLGPILSSILFLAAHQTTAAQGAFLLGVFSLGLALPFLLVASALSSASRYIHKIGPYLRIVSIVGGIFLILLGLILLTDNFSKLIVWGYYLLGFFPYEKFIIRFL